MSRIQTAFDELASRGSTRGAERIYSDVVQALGSRRSGPSVLTGQREEVIMVSHIATAPRQRRGLVVSMAVFVAVLVVGVGMASLLRPASDIGSGGDVGSGSGAAPVVTLPAVDPAAPPMTVLAGTELSFYAYLPDLQLAWRATGDGGTEICWRTISGEGCAPDAFFAPVTLVIPAQDEVIVLTRPNVASGEPINTDMVVVLSTGETITGPITTPEGIGIGYARFQLGGATVESATAR